MVKAITRFPTFVDGRSSRPTYNARDVGRYLPAAAYRFGSGVPRLTGG
ncbi:MAG: hypothetical protein U0797_19875 [Gemmataceae bacterium]